MFNNIIIIITSIIMSSSAHVFLKKGMMVSSRTSFSSSNILNSAWITATNPWVLTGMILHVSALIVWLWALYRVDITFAYPFLALGYVLVSLMAWLWLGEQLTTAKIIGMSVIFIGIMILALGGQSQA